MNTNTPDDTLSRQLNELAGRWLGRPLSAAEERELARFRQSLQPGSDGFREQVRTQAERAVNEGRQRAQTTIRDALEGAREVTEQMAHEREQEDLAVLKVVESASSLSELRPGRLHPPGQDAAPGGQIVIAQIADRLANLVRAEVQACFEHQFGPIAKQVEAAASAAQASPAREKPVDTQDATPHSSDVPNP